MSDAGDNELDQLNSVMFEIDGKQVPFGELDPQMVKEWQETHSNMDQFTKSNTQKSQEIAAAKREADTMKQTYEKDLQELNTIRQYLAQHPDLAQMIEGYVNSHQGGQQMQQNAQFPMGIHPQLEERLKKIEDMLTKSGERLDEDERSRQRSSAYEFLKEKYGDKFNKDEFDKFFLNETGDLESLNDLYNLVHLARLGSQQLASQQKQGSDLEQGETATGKIEPNVVIDGNLSPEEKMDKVWEGLAKQEGIQDY